MEYNTVETDGDMIIMFLETCYKDKKITYIYTLSIYITNRHNNIYSTEYLLL